MKQILYTLFLISLVACKNGPFDRSSMVNDADELKTAIEEAEPGADIVMANGIWKDVEIRLDAIGTEEKPIQLRAETPGGVVIQGVSSLQIGGAYLVVDGLVFKDGYSPSSAVIDFRTDKDHIATHCKVTNCVIEGFNKMQRNQTDLWVRMLGRHNELSNNYLAGKSNRGPTVRVDLEGNKSIKNYHKISNNHFGPRPPKGGPSAETIQIGNSYTSMAPSYTMVSDNLFERCNGEVEIISSKSNFNEFRNNVFYKSEGSLVTRHGNYCTVNGNYFIGDKNSEQYGGIRLIGSGHWVTNNYFYNLRGENFRSPLAVMNGIPKSPLNRYIQVTDVVVAHNTYIDCVAPLQFGVGSNIAQKDVLPKSEIRSARPIRTTVANNLIYNSTGDANPVVAHDELDGIDFQNNIINNQGAEFNAIEGIDVRSFDVSELSENLLVPSGDIYRLEPFMGFEFESITKDLFGSSRAENSGVGALSEAPLGVRVIYDKSNYGPSWFTQTQLGGSGKVHEVNSIDELRSVLTTATGGDRIHLKSGSYTMSKSLVIDKAITISSDSASRASIVYLGSATTPAFEMFPKGQLTLQHVNLKGAGSQYAFASRRENMSSLYNLTLENCAISDFDFILKAYKYSFAEHIILRSSSFINCNNGLELSEESEDKGEYNAEHIIIDDCQFDGVAQNVIDYYRGGYDESTVGGHLLVQNSSFVNCGAKEKNGILLNTYGIINVGITGNVFNDNPVQQVALLWGAKNNNHSDNTINNSGKIVTEENLKLKLFY